MASTMTLTEAKDGKTAEDSHRQYRSINRMTPEAVQEICKERNMWSQPHLNTQLYLNYKGFETIEGLEDYTNIRALHLGNNNIAKIDGLDRMSDLRSLVLDGNRIMYIDNLHANLQLRQLSLESNAIKCLKGLSHLTKLDQLNVSKNALSTLEDLEELKLMPGLVNVDVSQNQIEASDGVIDFWASLPGNVKVLRYHGNPGIRFIEHYRKRMVNSLPGLKYLDERPIFPVERKSCAAWAEGGLQAMQKAKKDHFQEQQRVQHAVDPDRREFLTRQRKLAIARIEREEQERREQAEREEQAAQPMTRVQAGDQEALDEYARSWKKKVECYGAEKVREQVSADGAAASGLSASQQQAAKAAAAAVAEAQRRANEEAKRVSSARDDRHVAGPSAMSFAPPSRRSSSSARPAASDFKQTGQGVDDHIDRQFGVYEDADFDAGADRHQAATKAGSAKEEVVPDLWKNLQVSSKEAEAKIHEMNAANSAAFSQAQKAEQAAAPAAGNAANELEGLD